MSWAEEITALRLQVKRRGVRKVKTPEGSERYGQPIGTIIRPGVDLPKAPRGGGGRKPAAPKPTAPKPAVVKGQTPGKFVHPTTGHQMGKTEIGDTFEQLFSAKMRKGLEEHFGCCLKLITGAGGGSARNTPLDFQVGQRGGEVKTLNALAKNQKTAIKKEEVARKIAACRTLGVEPVLVVQVVNQKTGEVDVYGHPAFASKAVKAMTYFGSYRFTARDFQRAQERSGHWEKAEGRAAAEKEKATKTQTKQLAGAVGEAYDPPDEEGGVIETGDTVVELREVDGWLIPHIYTAGEEEEGEEKGLRRVRTPEGARRYNQPIGTVITPTPSLPASHLIPRSDRPPPQLWGRPRLTRARPPLSRAFTRTPTEDPEDIPISGAVHGGFHTDLPDIGSSTDLLTRADPLQSATNRSFAKREVVDRLYRALGDADREELARWGAEAARSAARQHLADVLTYTPSGGELPLALHGRSLADEIGWLDSLDPFSPDVIWSDPDWAKEVDWAPGTRSWALDVVASLRRDQNTGQGRSIRASLEKGEFLRRGDDPAVKEAMARQAISDFVATWAATSNDANVRSLAVQDAAFEEFDLDYALDWEGGVDWSAVPEGELAKLNPAQRESVERMRAQQVEEQANTPLYRRLLRAMYEDTQRWLAEHGIDEVVLHRGMQWDDRHEPPAWVHLAGDDTLTGLPNVVDADDDGVLLRPLSSWAASYRIAESFGHEDSGGEGVILSTVVPAELILSVPRTGFGALPEWEFVILAPSSGKYMLREP